MKKVIVAVVLIIALFGSALYGIHYFRGQLVIDSAAQTAKLERNLSGK